MSEEEKNLNQCMTDLKDSRDALSEEKAKLQACELHETKLREQRDQTQGVLDKKLTSTMRQLEETKTGSTNEIQRVKEDLKRCRTTKSGSTREASNFFIKFLVFFGIFALLYLIISGIMYGVAKSNYEDAKTPDDKTKVKEEAVMNQMLTLFAFLFGSVLMIFLCWSNFGYEVLGLAPSLANVFLLVIIFDLGFSWLWLKNISTM